MRPLSDLDTMFLVPVNVDEFVEAFSESPVPGVAYAINRHEDNITVTDGGIVVAEVYLTVLGGCVVRTAPIMGDADEMASFLTDAGESEALIAAEEAAVRGEELIEQLGGVPAYLKSNKWVPILPNDRPAWSARVVAENTRKMRLVANENRSARLARAV